MAAMEAATVEQFLAPLIADPQRSAVLLDVDGTLAPITTDTHAATVPSATREVLAQIADRYKLVACITGRQCERAREMVGLGNITYFGNHGSEIMRPGSSKVEIAPEAAAWQERVQAFAAGAYADSGLERFGIRTEDKGPIAGLHWRGVDDEAAAEAAVRQVAQAAEAAGFGLHWAKKILEIRPPSDFSKGSAVHQLLSEQEVDNAIFVGDDLTDIHAFKALDEARAAGEINHAGKIGVDSDEAPPELAPAADVMLPGTEAVVEMLRLLAAA